MILFELDRLLSSAIGLTVLFISALGSSLETRILGRAAHYKTNEVISPLAYSESGNEIAWTHKAAVHLNLNFPWIV